MIVGITGAAGYIGSRVMHDAMKAGHEVLGLDNFYLGQTTEVLGNRIVNADIRNLEKTESLLRDCDAIVHLAAISGVDDCKKNKNRAYKTNIIGTQNIAWICHKHNIPLIFVSSMAVFGNPEKFPIEEDDPKNPINFYGLTKLLCMKNIEKLSKENFPAYIFILGNVYGNHKIGEKTITKQTVVNIFINQAREGKALTVYEPGTQARDFINVKDVSRAFVESLEKLAKDKKQVVLYNFSSSKSYSVMDIADFVKQANPKKTKIKLTPNPRDNETLVKDFHVDTSKLRKELSFHPKINIQEEIQDSI